MTEPKNLLFVSYSHKDKTWLDRLRPHFASLHRLGELREWDDQQIKTGAKWYDEIKAKLSRARVAVLLISPDFLASDFCMKHEVPDLLEQAEAVGLLLVPILIRPCALKVEPWLKSQQMVPRDGQPVSSFYGQPDDYDELFAEIVEFIHAEVPPPPVITIPVDIDRLPPSGRELFGRKDELAFLDEAWETAGTNVVSLVAWGGLGKSALVNRWLEGAEETGLGRC